MKILYILSLSTGVLELLFFSGIIFGWGSIRYVLQKEGYFSNYCTPSEKLLNVTDTPILNNVSISSSLLNSTLVGNITGKDCKETEVSMETYPSCDKQSQAYILVFTIASCALSFSTLPNGYIFDKFGTWISRVLAILLFTLGCVFVGISTIDTSDLLYPAMSCFAIGGILFLVTNLQIGNLFNKLRMSVVTLYSGALDSSSFVFLLVKIAYDNGFNFKDIFLFIAFCTILLWIRTFLFLPKMHIPFPIPKTGIKLGLQDCRSNKEPKEIEGQEMEQLTVESKSENKNNSNSEINYEDEVKPGEIEDDMTYTDCIKSGLFWSNTLHFSILQLRNYFFLSSIFDWLLNITNSDNAVRTACLQNTENECLENGYNDCIQGTVSDYLNVFGTCQFLGIFFAPLNGLVIDSIIKMYKSGIPKLIPLKAVMCSAVITSLLGTIFSIIVAIPSLKLQYLSFVLQVVFRSFLYGGNASFIAISFPGKHFGKVYGLTMTLGGVISLLQFPLFTLVQDAMGGDFLVINILFVFVSLAVLVHPLYVYIHCRVETKKLKNALTNGNSAHA